MTGQKRCWSSSIDVARVGRIVVVGTINRLAVGRCENFAVTKSPTYVLIKGRFCVRCAMLWFGSNRCGSVRRTLSETRLISPLSESEAVRFYTRTV